MPETLSSDDKVIGRKDGPVAHVIVNNPQKHNAVSLEMWQAMDALIEGFAADDKVRLLVVSGAGGKAFVSGADISKFETERATREAVALYNATSAGLYEKLCAFPRPTIARIEGYCIGGGVNLAVCCDLRFCTEASRFSIPAARLGLGYGYPGLKRLADIIGLPRAKEMFYTARQFSAAEACEMGLVNGVFEEAGFEEGLAEIAERIADNAPLTLATIKAAAQEIAKEPAARDLERVEAMVRDCFDSEDYVEGRRAFMDKRRPVFKGR